MVKLRFVCIVVELWGLGRWICCRRYVGCVFWLAMHKESDASSSGDILFLTLNYLSYFGLCSITSGGSRKFFQGVQRSLQNLNITSLKKKNYVKFYKILLQVFEYNITKKKKIYMKFYKILLRVFIA